MNSRAMAVARMVAAELSSRMHRYDGVARGLSASPSGAGETPQGASLVGVLGLSRYGPDGQLLGSRRPDPGQALPGQAGEGVAELVKAVVESQNSQLGPTGKSEEDGWSVTLAQPHIRGGEVVSVLAMRCQIPDLTDRLTELSEDLGEQSIMAGVVNRRGEFVARSETTPAQFKGPLSMITELIPGEELQEELKSGLVLTAVPLFLSDEVESASLFAVVQMPKIEFVQELSDLQTVMGELAWRRELEFAVGSLAILLFATLYTWFFAGRLAQPIIMVSTMLEEIADGESGIERRLKLGRNDEIGTLADAFDRHVSSLEEAMLDVSRNSTATQMRASGAAVASKKIQESIQAVAAAIEEFSASSGEIARTSVSAAEYMRSAEERAGSAKQSVERLQEGGNKISEMSELIEKVSRQTRLLAVNAAIEAARAGDRGLGFATVAGEVKQLALLTGNANADIATAVVSLHEEIGSTAAALEAVFEKLSELGLMISTVASAIDEQSVTINEISGNLSQVARETGEVNASAQEVAGLATDTDRKLERFRSG